MTANDGADVDRILRSSSIESFESGPSDAAPINNPSTPPTIPRERFPVMSR
jgi:hypothetical protein